MLDSSLMQISISFFPLGFMVGSSIVRKFELHPVLFIQCGALGNSGNAVKYVCMADSANTSWKSSRKCAASLSEASLYLHYNVIPL